MATGISGISAYFLTAIVVLLSGDPPLSCGSMIVPPAGKCQHSLLTNALGRIIL
jgi:hypothetical protein